MRQGSSTHLGLHEAAQQRAGADRFQRGGTLTFFMLIVLLQRVLASLAAAQLERSAALW
jgi:hypothetical protein